MVQYDFDESINGCGSVAVGGYGNSYEAQISRSYLQSNWNQIAESTMPLRLSKLASSEQAAFQASVEFRSRQISSKLISINIISIVVNLVLAIVAFYLSFTNESTSSSAFAADCLLDFISGAIVLWRYYGDVTSLYMHAREQIACIYLGALFEISAIAIIVKASSDLIYGVDLQAAMDSVESQELFYLAIVASIACSVITAYKVALFKILRDNSILLDVINTLISTVFALSIIMSQSLMGVSPNFWYLDPVLSILLAIFMIGFGLKVLCQNYQVLRPANSSYRQMTGNNSSGFFKRQNGMNEVEANSLASFSSVGDSRGAKNYGSSLTSIVVASVDGDTTWQKSDCSAIKFAA